MESHNNRALIFFGSSVTGIVLVTLADSRKKGDGISVGALWALASAFL